MNPELSNLLFGGQSGWMLFGYLLIALVGVLLSLLLHASARDVKSESSPVQFSWNFLWSDNMRRIAAGLLLILVVVRFTPELLHVELNAFIALLIGFGSDKLAQLVKDNTSLLDKKKE